MTGLEIGGIIVALLPIIGTILAYALRRKTRAEKAAAAGERLRQNAKAFEDAVRSEDGGALSIILDHRLRDLDLLLGVQPPSAVDGGPNTEAEGSTVPLSGVRK